MILFGLGGFKEPLIVKSPWGISGPLDSLTVTSPRVPKYLGDGCLMLIAVARGRGLHYLSFRDIGRTDFV